MCVFTIARRSFVQLMLIVALCLLPACTLTQHVDPALIGRWKSESNRLTLTDTAGNVTVGSIGYSEIEFFDNGAFVLDFSKDPQPGPILKGTFSADGQHVALSVDEVSIASYPKGTMDQEYRIEGDKLIWIQPRVTMSGKDYRAESILIRIP